MGALEQDARKAEKLLDGTRVHLLCAMTKTPDVKPK